MAGAGHRIIILADFDKSASSQFKNQIISRLTHLLLVIVPQLKLLALKNSTKCRTGKVFNKHKHLQLKIETNMQPICQESCEHCKDECGYSACVQAVVAQ